jgi:hypothetical protein
MAAKGTSIRIFLVDGTPDGLRLIEKSLWTGIGVVCSRNTYPAVRKRDEFTRPGIYVLTGPDPAIPGGQIAYIGQAEIARQRLDQHSTGKDFWTHLVLFTNKDANLNNAHFRYLESRLIQRGQQAKRAKLMNGNQPGTPQLSEAEIADAEAFLENMLLIYPLVGVDVFEVAQIPVTPELSFPAAGPVEFILSGSGVNARGTLTPDGFLVHKDSMSVETTVQSFQSGYLALRNELIQSGVLIPDGGGFRFAQNFLFKSPSAAGGVVLGRNTNGRKEWKTADGQTLAQIQAAQIGQSTEDDSWTGESTPDGAEHNSGGIDSTISSK